MELVDTWQFEMPEGWLRKDSESPGYLEEPGGTKGLYVKSIVLSQPKSSPWAAAEYVQSVHLESFNEANGSNWAVMEREIKEQHGLARSVLDLYDTQAGYRVLSVVVCGQPTGNPDICTITHVRTTPPLATSSHHWPTQFTTPSQWSNNSRVRRRRRSL